jgi:hypothetical protein
VTYGLYTLSPEEGVDRPQPCALEGGFKLALDLALELTVVAVVLGVDASLPLLLVPKTQVQVVFSCFKDSVFPLGGFFADQRLYIFAVLENENQFLY